MLYLFNISFNSPRIKTHYQTDYVRDTFCSRHLFFDKTTSEYDLIKQIISRAETRP